jgi:type IV pilus assembly protein PilV
MVIPGLAQHRAQRGATLIEILVTLVIIAFGLLGMAGLQAQLQVSGVESYQRSQALLLLNDMANRIAANRNNAASYVTGTSSPTGTSATCGTVSGTSTRAEIDMSEWCNSLLGAAEVSGTDKVGAMIGARGCIVQSGTNDYRIEIAWQGLSPLGTPPAGLACGANSYNSTTTGAACSSDRCRRVVSTLVRIGTLPTS